jgi:hypothetical protein
VAAAARAREHRGAAIPASSSVFLVAGSAPVPACSQRRVAAATAARFARAASRILSLMSIASCRGLHGTRRGAEERLAIRGLVPARRSACCCASMPTPQRLAAPARPLEPGRPYPRPLIITGRTRRHDALPVEGNMSSEAHDRFDQCLQLRLGGRECDLTRTRRGAA